LAAQQLTDLWLPAAAAVAAAAVAVAAAAAAAADLRAVATRLHNYISARGYTTEPEGRSLKKVDDSSTLRA
jgi:hypothetical protein